MRAVSAFVLLVLCAATVTPPLRAQMDEQPPVLKRGDSGNGNNGSQTGRSKTETAKNTTPAVTATGVVRRIDANSIQVEAEDTRVLTCKLTKTTTFSGPDGKLTADDIDIGMRVRIRARTDEEGEELTATSVVMENSAVKPSGDEKTVTVLKTPAEDDADRPILRHGVPPKRKKTDDDDDDDDKVASAKPAGELSRSAPRMDGESEPVEKPKPATLIDKAREANGEFTEKLPSFVCQQFTTRYFRESKQSGWQAQDVVSATVVYVDGKENYENVKVGNKAVQKDMMDIKGQRSVGEFGSVLRSLFARSTNDDFHFVKDQQVKHLNTKVYDFAIRREDSDWQIMMSGQSIVPGYSGRVWIDKESGRVLRIERQADKIPVAFPMDTLEQTIDYDFVLIGDRKFLLPTESENLSCQRETPLCGKNVIEFRDYKQFRGDASITFDK